MSQPGTAAGPDRLTVKNNCRRLLSLYENDKSREALTEVNRLLQQAPGELEYLRCRMHIYCDLDNPTAAVKDGEALLKVNPRDAEANFTLGNLYTARREYNKARIAFNRCLEEDPHWAAVYSWKSRIDYEEGKFESALSNANQALKYDPDMGSAWTNKAMALCELHQLDKAMVAMKRAIALNGASPKMRNNLALILLGLERYQEALAELNIVIKQAPQMMLAYINRSSVNNALKRPKEALDDLNHAIALGGDKFPYLFTNRACVYSETGKYREAIADCEQALQRNKKFPKAYEVMGYAYY
ncbi:MAG: tetratricopeptide repeat protein, partial [Cyanobacteria bacterium SZAS LIN-2]|nr:tetratricopeptide repeat protein [Cyanobacteria bacterium SZAS LIN-2]